MIYGLTAFRATRPHHRLGLIKQAIDVRLWQRHVEYLEKFLSKSSHMDEANRLGIRSRLMRAKAMLSQVKSTGYLQDLKGTIGAEPLK